MNIILSNRNPDPIYLQISKQIKHAIFTEELKPSEPLPSIRKLAKDLGVSVITTKRAFEELEKEGLIYTVRGKGNYIYDKSGTLIHEYKLKVIEDKLSEAIEESKLLNLSLEDLKQMLTILY